MQDTHFEYAQLPFVAWVRGRISMVVAAYDGLDDIVEAAIRVTRSALQRSGLSALLLGQVIPDLERSAVATLDEPQM
jgi:hypothetical protein